MYEKSELIINDDDSIFHLHLLTEQIADDIILAGDHRKVDVFCKDFEKNRASCTK